MTPSHKEEKGKNRGGGYLTFISRIQTMQERRSSSCRPPFLRSAPVHPNSSFLFGNGLRNTAAFFCAALRGPVVRMQ